MKKKDDQQKGTKKKYDLEEKKMQFCKKKK